MAQQRLTALKSIVQASPPQPHFLLGSRGRDASLTFQRDVCVCCVIVEAYVGQCDLYDPTRTLDHRNGPGHKGINEGHLSGHVANRKDRSRAQENKRQ